MLGTQTGPKPGEIHCELGQGCLERVEAQRLSVIRKNCVDEVWPKRSKLGSQSDGDADARTMRLVNDDNLVRKVYSESFSCIFVQQIVRQRNEL